MEELFLKRLEPDEQIIDIFTSNVKKVISPLEYIFIPFFIYSMCLFINNIFNYKTIVKMPEFLPFYTCLMLFVFWLYYFKFKVKNLENTIYCLTNLRLCQIQKTQSGNTFSTISFSSKNPLIIHNLIERVKNGNEYLLSTSKKWIILALLILCMLFYFVVIWLQV